MLVHICCSVDSHYFLTKLRECYPNEKIIGYFYNPNIHPQSEYDLRLYDVKISCESLNIPLIVEEYALESWMDATRELQESPEKGERCNVCFTHRLEKTAQKALTLGISSITTTLLMSPKKSIEKLQTIGETIATKYNLDFFSDDFRSDGGTSRQFAAAKELRLYQQNYCGCFFALGQQNRNREFHVELFSPLNKSYSPTASQNKLPLFQQRDTQNATLLKSTALDYCVKKFIFKKENIPTKAHLLPYSMTNLKMISGKIAAEKNNIFYLEKGGVIIISLATYNTFSPKKFSSVDSLLSESNTFETEVQIRTRIDGNYSFNPIVILDTVSLDAKYTVELESSIQLGTTHRVL